ncbi:FadR/GntR family transcriptional regulator [Desulfofustis glycolicus]|uniref:Transcriptional regulator, GntR family n=1 Tax=Desulfofustis glycolicus DSM 9705 TaxID=1121409 RepID=A0A1M5U6W1_9BACT|nr:FadR/GntR family transcriptional regulator [Desulfofustis glycolicus]MCB2214617.1 FadR family transcriptional regulator [Desulfobulbaceae bacterium]SHH58782.1 transcriptional regulator, GntR family [Desulfofustis glycolicus DSM 9705]
MGVHFHKAKQNRIYQDVVEQIQNAILDGQIVPGDKLPPERELCEMFQASRGTLREALRILEQKSLIEIRLGMNGGAYVKDANAELMAENLAILIQSQNVSLRHLAEFREVVEGAVAELAAVRATATDKRKLADLIGQAAGYREQGPHLWDKFVHMDEKIHIELACVAGNPLYRFIHHSIHKNIHRYYDTLLIVGKDEMEENFRDLSAIVDAVVTGDAERAKRCAADHVRRFSAYMEQKKRHTPDR